MKPTSRKRLRVRPASVWQARLDKDAGKQLGRPVIKVGNREAVNRR